MTEATDKNSRKLFKTAGRNSFFEVYDATNINRMEIQITLWDPDTHTVTDQASYFIELPEMLALCEVILNNTFDDYCSNDKAFPRVGFSVPRGRDQMRKWDLSHNSTGSYTTTIEVREAREKWTNEAPQIAKASFTLPPFSMVMMAATIKNFILSKPELLYKVASGQQEPRVERAQA